MRSSIWAILIVCSVVIFGSCYWFYARYAISIRMHIRMTTFSQNEYPDNPAQLSHYAGRYSHKGLILVKKDTTHFDFIFLPANPKSATIIFKNVDVSLMTPNIPLWVKGSSELILIALTDRQWNRQQVAFAPQSPAIEIIGGDGFEKKHLYSAELAKNCLNAGLWEVLLFTKENGEKTLYDQGWFTFPLGYYKQLFEYNTDFSYWYSWYYLEHWFTPKNKVINLSLLRRVIDEKNVAAFFNSQAPIQAKGEQQRKRKNIIAPDVHVWGDYFSDKQVVFSSFIPPGIYQLKKSHENEYWRLAHFDGAVLRNIISPADPNKALQELELTFSDVKGNKSYFIISGFAIDQLPHLNVNNYDKGFFMPMGIGVPPIYQSYTELLASPPNESPFFSVYLSADNKWINHHEVGIDGPLIFIDKDNPKLLHVYLVSYEREAVIAHYLIEIK